MRAARWFATLGISVALAACGGENTSTPPATPPTPTTAATPGVAPAGGGNPEQGEADELRGRHHGGFAMLIAMSVRDLSLTADQKTTIEKIRSDLQAKMEPARAAGKAMAGVLADGVAAGAVDRSKADAAITAVANQAQAMHGATADALNQLHAALTPAQRAQLVDKVQEHLEKWKEANGHEEQQAQGQPHRSGHLLGLAKDVGITKDEAEKIRANFREIMRASAPDGGAGGAGGGGPQDHGHQEVANHLQAFATAFKADTFDAHTLATEGPANGHMARWGATRMARFLEAAAPVLTPDQRTKLAQIIRDRANG